jgi:hypothetical protein
MQAFACQSFWLCESKEFRVRVIHFIFLVIIVHGTCMDGQHQTSADVSDVTQPRASVAVAEADNDPEVLIECHDVYKAFGEKQILKGASFKARLLVMLDVVVNASPRIAISKGIILRDMNL